MGPKGVGGQEGHWVQMLLWYCSGIIVIVVVVVALS
jgi:hypothetical protein